MTALSFVVAMIFPALLVAAAVSDLLTMTIPNRLSLALAAAFPLAAVLAGLEPAAMGWHLAAGAGVLAFCFTLFALNWIGGGDAKLAAAIALWVGPSMLLFEWALLAAVAGGVLTLAILAARRIPLPVMLAGQGWIVRLHDRRTGIPYGIALAAAGLAVCPSATVFTRLVA